jgi:hypothetical protein
VHPAAGVEMAHGVELEAPEGPEAQAMDTAAQVDLVARGLLEDRGPPEAVAHGALGPVLGAHLASGPEFGLLVQQLPPRLRLLQSRLP